MRLKEPKERERVRVRERERLRELKGHQGAEKVISKLQKSLKIIKPLK